MLAGKGFKKVFNIAGGIKAWHSKTAVGPETLGVNLFDSLEQPLEVLKTAYSMEQGLREFYLTLGEKAKNSKVKELFSNLAEIEIKHQDSIFKAHNNIAREEISREDFEKSVAAKALEGGLSTKEYLDLFNPDLNSALDVISLAMSIEAQALDLYQRVSVKVDNVKSKNVINRIANEEKEHLASLGRLMDSLENKEENRS